MMAGKDQAITQFCATSILRATVMKKTLLKRPNLELKKEDALSQMLCQLCFFVIREGLNVQAVSELVICPSSEDEGQIPLEKQMTFLVFESALMLLFSTCVACGSTVVSIKRHIIGTFLSIKQVCTQCNNTFVWESQPYISNIPAGNLLTSAAILYTGSLPAKALRIFKTLNCATISKVTYFRHQKAICTQLFMIFGRKTRCYF